MQEPDQNLFSEPHRAKIQSMSIKDKHDQPKCDVSVSTLLVLTKRRNYWRQPYNTD